MRLTPLPPGAWLSRRTVLGAIAIAAAGMLAACSSTGFGGGGFGGIGAGSGPAVRTAEPVTGEVIGSGTVRIAMLLPLSATGNAGQIAANFKNAATLALQDFKSANIQVMVKDDQGTPQGAGAAASEAISQGAELILGPLFARSVSAVAAVARQANVPVIAFSSDTTAAAPGVYLLSFLPQSDVDRIVSFASARGKRSLASLLPNNAYGTLVEAEMQRAAANVGARVVASLHYDLDKQSMQTQAASLATTIKSGAVDAVFLPDAGDATPFLAQILAANGVTADKIAYLGSGQWDNDPRISSESNLNGGWYPAPESAGFASFARRYQAAFGAAPSRTASLAYDATSLAAGLTARFGEQRFAQATLTNPNGFIGIDGAFRFLSNGLNQRGLAVFQVNRGSAQMVEPAPKTFTTPSG